MNKQEFDQADSQPCLNAAFRYLSYRPRSESELRTCLQRRGFDRPSIEEVLFKLKEQGLADDFAFAQFWKENRESFSPRSRAMLRQELRRKGINAEIIAEVTEEIEEESSAYRAAKRKVKVSTISDYLAFRHKLFSFLKGRGFDYEVCQRTINRMWQESEKERGNA